MAMYKTFLSIYIFLMCVNGFVLIVETSSGQGLTTPFDYEKHCHNALDQPIGITNSTGFFGTYSSEVECNAAASTYTWHSLNFDVNEASLEIMTSDGSFISSTTNSTYASNPIALLAGELMIWDAIWGFWNIITAGGLFTVLATFGIPEIFVQVMQSIMGIYLVLTILSIKWQF